MKHHLFIFFSLWLMTSCVQNEYLEGKDDTNGQESLISFKQDVNNTFTESRATQMTISSIQSYGVSCSVYSKDKTYKDAECGSYFYNKEVNAEDGYTGYYWPGKDYRLSFFAYTPYGNPNITISPASIKGMIQYDYSVPASVSEQVDFMTCNVLDHEGTSQTPVPLSFRHKCSDLRFEVYNQSKSAVQLQSISVMGMKYKGTLTNDAWMLDESVNTSSEHPFVMDKEILIDPKSTVDATGVENHFILLPQDITAETEFFTINTIQDGKQHQYSYSLKEPLSFVEGKSYKLRIVLGGSSVELEDIEILPWQSVEKKSNLEVNEDLTVVKYTDGTVKTFDCTYVPAGKGYQQTGTAFFGTPSTVKSVRLGRKVTSIGAYAFSFFENLEELYIPCTVTSIGNGAVSFCYSLKSLHISHNIKAIPEQLCESDHALETVTFADDITSVGMGAFNNCKLLTEIRLPSTVKEIGRMSFSHCYAIKSITLSRDLESIGVNAFTDDKALLSFEIEPGNTHFSVIDGVLYDKDVTTIISFPLGRTKEYVLPSTITTIPKTIGQYSKLESLVVHDDVTIESFAFNAANNLKSIVFGANCKIGTNAFRQDINGAGDTALKSVTFNGKVTFDGYAIFWGCKNLSSIVYNSIEAPEFNTSVILSSYNGWSSTTAKNAVGYNTRTSGTNMFYVPKNATYTDNDLEKQKAVLFDANYCGFTLSKTL